MKVTIAGASGFIGKNLIAELQSEFDVRCLSRFQKQDISVNWVKADLFSYTSTAKALEETDVAIYLVHSMLPSSKLFQGNFEDTDLLLADNFARACKKNNIKQIIYLGGVVPISGSSKHLESRLEVEEVFKSTGISLTVLRAGMVVGDGGSSFEILKSLVLNLPAMILPKWTENRTQVIYLDDLITVIKNSIGNETFLNKTFDIVTGEYITFKELIVQTSNYFKLNKPMIPVPINYTSFSKLWVSLFGEADIELVSPLIDSLLCDFPAHETPSEVKPFINYKTYAEMLEKISKERLKPKEVKNFSGVKNVRSIQRLPNCKNFSQEEVSDMYINWLPKHMRFFICANREGDYLKFKITGFSSPLLTLRKIKETGSLERVKFHIVGGILTKSKNTGWLEFRRVADGKYTLASINEFIPSLPWYFYKYTQAPIHASVMKSFGDYLRKI